MTYVPHICRCGALCYQPTRIYKHSQQRSYSSNQLFVTWPMDASIIDNQSSPNKYIPVKDNANPGCSCYLINLLQIYSKVKSQAPKKWRTCSAQTQTNSS
ncbi:hypothetical protein FGO68_gene14790 [Halteria grandinella]|uniref:Uncharacterized protein n=1 Tax=Halteria grandinella TaxID=5974 RepID=A0A8J8NBB4_HALGN|nr:hypothetical protein FGO68_gene14790 [Halteria grandinella]